VQQPGLRYYSSGFGRWQSRDPIGERGGLNLLVGCDNDSVSAYDSLGHIGSRGKGVENQKVCCRRAAKAFSKYSDLWDSDAVDKIWYMREKCGLGDKKIGIKCARKCDKDTGGYHDWGSRTLTLCAKNRSRTWGEWNAIIRHELTHMFDHECGATMGCKGGSAGLQRRVCSELRAYKFAGDLESKQEIIDGAVSSVYFACSKSRPNGMSDNQWRLILKAYATSLYETCAEKLGKHDPIPAFPQ
jgi:hypothetical protein